MTVEGTKPVMYWQVDKGEKHQVPENAHLLVWDAKQKCYTEIFIGKDGTVKLVKKATR
jgi:hypothetical protein